MEVIFYTVYKAILLKSADNIAQQTAILIGLTIKMIWRRTTRF